MRRSTRPSAKVTPEAAAQDMFSTTCLPECPLKAGCLQISDSYPELAIRVALWVRFGLCDIQLPRSLHSFTHVLAASTKLSTLLLLPTPLITTYYPSRLTPTAKSSPGPGRSCGSTCITSVPSLSVYKTPPFPVPLFLLASKCMGFTYGSEGSSDPRLLLVAN
jgi:hypothetical protein